jgi:hypothetical protein
MITTAPLPRIFGWQGIFYADWVRKFGLTDKSEIEKRRAVMHCEKSQAKATNYVLTDQIIQAKKYDGISILPLPIQKQANLTGMPDSLKTGVERLSGFSMDDVRVHFNSPKPAQLQALAYTQGTDIHVAPGQEQHLPHEAWHVAQQMQGRVQPTFQMKEAGVAVNDDPALEREADEMGANADHYSDFNALGQDIVNHGDGSHASVGSGRTVPLLLSKEG